MLGLKKAGGRGAPAGGLEGAEPPRFANVLAFPPRQSFEKRLSITGSNNNNKTIEILKIKVKVKSKLKSKKTSKSKSK